MQHTISSFRFRSAAAAAAAALALAFGALFLTAPANAYADPIETLDVTDLSNCGINYSADGSDKEDDYEAFKAALDKAAEDARAKGGEVEVFAPAGTYYLGKTLRIGSNVTLRLDEDAIMKPTGELIADSGNFFAMIANCHVDANGNNCKDDSNACKHGGYSQTSNIKLVGGTWDGGDTTGKYDRGIVNFTHANGVTLENVTFKNTANHLVSVDGCNNVTATGCTFADQHPYKGTSKKFWGNTPVGNKARLGSTEALHTDYLAPASSVSSGYPRDNTPTCNVTVDRCKFSNVLSGVGTHHANSKHAKNYKVTNCTFSNLMMYAMKGYDFENALFQNNTVKNSPYMVFTERCKGFDIKDNTASGITTIGVNLRQGTTGTVSGNTITVSSSGEACVRVADGSATVSGNTLSGAKKGVGSVSSKALISKNKVSCPKGTALYVYGGSATVEKNTVTAASVWGIGFDNKVKNGVIKGNVVKGARTGITIRKSTKKVKISGNKIYSTKDNGIYLDTSCSARISSNLVSKPARSAVRLTKKSFASITNNTFSATKSHAINADSSSVTASGNTIAASKGCGILFKKGTLKAAGNSITTKSGAGITAENASKGSYLKSNTIWAGKGKGIFVKSAKACQIVKNKVKKAKYFGIQAEGTKKAPCKVRVKGNKVTAKGLSKKTYVGAFAKKY